MKIKKLKEVIEIVSAANEEDVKLRNHDVPDSVAEVRIGAGIAQHPFRLTERERRHLSGGRRLRGGYLQRRRSLLARGD